MASTSRPTRRSTSASVRTVVVLPVPPFSDRTAIVSAAAIAAAGYLLHERLRAGDCGCGHSVQEEQRVAADRELVAVGERAPLDPPAVDRDAVERTVVEHPNPRLLTGDQRMTARDRRVVEADVGGQRPPDPGPLAGHGADDDAVVLRERDVAPRGGETGPRLLQPRRRRGPGRGASRMAERARANARQRAGGLGVMVESWVHLLLPPWVRLTPPLRKHKALRVGPRPQLGLTLHRQGR